MVLSSEQGADSLGQRVDLVHDTLLRQVPVVASWIDRERDLLERHAVLEAAAGAWDQVGCPIEGLPTGSLLEHYEGLDAEARLRGRLTPMASERARRFLRSAQNLQQRRVRLRRVVVAALVACGVAISVSALIAWQQRSRAEANLRRAESSLQSLILTAKQVASDTDWKLGRVLHTLEARQVLLQYVDDSLASLPEADKATLKLIMAIAGTKHRRSDLARLNESLDGAEVFTVGAREQIEKGLKSDRSNHDLLELSALNHSKQGKIELARGRNAAALAEFATSVKLLQQMNGEGDDYRRTLATSDVEYAEAELALGEFSAAATSADAALELLWQNDSDYDRSQLALALRMRGVAAREGGDIRAEAAYLERARSLMEPLFESSPGIAYYQWILATIRAELAALRIREGRLADAADLSRRAHEVAEELHRADPSQKDYALLLCRVLSDSAEIAKRRGDRGGGKGSAPPGV